MFCPKCGTKNPDNAKFCKKCGMNLGIHKDFSEYYKKSASGSLKKGISLEGIIIGNVFIFTAFTALSALVVILLYGTFNIEKLQTVPVSDFEFILCLSMLVILLIIAGILAGYLGGRKYINGVLNGFMATLFTLICFGIIANGILFLIWPLIFGSFGIIGGILGVFIKKRF